MSSHILRNAGPVQTCQVCGDSEQVVPDGRGFPPDIAKRRLVKRCKAAGHKCEPRYEAGLVIHVRDEEER